MSIAELDFYFPFIVFSYGAVMTFVLANPVLMKIARERLPEPHLSRFTSHQTLGWICVAVGGLWSLQNLWI